MVPKTKMFFLFLCLGCAIASDLDDLCPLGCGVPHEEHDQCGICNRYTCDGDCMHRLSLPPKLPLHLLLLPPPRLDMLLLTSTALPPSPRPTTSTGSLELCRRYTENWWGTTIATAQVHGTSPENATAHAIALVNEGEID